MKSMKLPESQRGCANLEVLRGSVGAIPGIGEGPGVETLSLLQIATKTSSSPPDSSKALSGTHEYLRSCGFWVPGT